MAAAPSFDLPDRPLEGKVVVVTGASRGLGAGLAARFAEQGAALGLCARNVPGAPTDARTVRGEVDVTDGRALEDFAGAVEGELGPIDLWVNNAGVLEPMGPLRDLRSDDVDRALLVNIGGVVNGTRAFVRRAGRQPAGRRALVNISSGAARSVYEGWSVYGATKAAVDHLTEIVAAEEPGIVCHAVAPGIVETDMQVAIRAADETTFPSVDRFRRLHADGAANSPAWVADHLIGLLTGALRPDAVVYRVPDEHP